MIKQLQCAAALLIFVAGAGVAADLSPYPHIIAWRSNVESRPAYKKMLAVARPDGVPGMPKPLPKT